MFFGKLTLQCTRNGSQNHPFCPGSIQDPFILFSSISENHNINTTLLVSQCQMAAEPGQQDGGITHDATSNSISLFLARRMGSELTPNGITWVHFVFVDKTDIDYFPARVFLYFSRKYDLGFLGQKRRIGDELYMLNTRKINLAVFLVFLVAK